MPESKAGTWVKEIPFAVTVCDREGIILEMNDKSAKTFEKYGSRDLIGKNVFDCHPEPARSKLKKLMGKQESNAYTVEKKGVKKLIYQTPWYENGGYMGFVEISIEIPKEMPHYKRD